MFSGLVKSISEVENFRYFVASRYVHCVRSVAAHSLHALHVAHRSSSTLLTIFLLCYRWPSTDSDFCVSYFDTWILQRHVKIIFTVDCFCRLPVSFSFLHTRTHSSRFHFIFSYLTEVVKYNWLQWNFHRCQVFSLNYWNYVKAFSSCTTLCKIVSFSYLINYF